MSPLTFLEQLPLAELFVACLACGAFVLLLVVVGVRLTLRALRVPPSQTLFEGNILVTLLSVLFTMLVAFSAAGIWNDQVQARAVMQREANAMENIFALASSYPTELREEVYNELIRHGRRILDSDWPAMQQQQRPDVNENLYDRSNNPLVALIARVATEAARGTQRLPLSDLMVGQVLELQSARLQREMIARGGISSAQWLAMLLIAIAALTVIMLSQDRQFSMRLRMAGIYAAAVSVAFVVILAHDRPFAGASGVMPIPIEQAIKRSQYAHAQQATNGTQ
jgi:hypothetical protein